jgi:hypothetical protein
VPKSNKRSLSDAILVIDARQAVRRAANSVAAPLATAGTNTGGCGQNAAPEITREG